MARLQNNSIKNECKILKKRLVKFVTFKKLHIFAT